MTTISETIRRLALQSTRQTITRWCSTGEIEASRVTVEGQPTDIWKIADGQDELLRDLDRRRRGRPPKRAPLD